MELFYVFAGLPFALWALPFFWAAPFVMLLFAVAALCAEDYDDGSLGAYIVATLLMVALGGYLFTPSVIAFVTSAHFGWFLAEYLIFGAAYAVFRWVLLVKKSANRIIENKEALDRQFLSDRYVSSGVKNFEDYLITIGYIPVVKQNKYRIFNWVFMWPFSLLRWSLTDLVKFIADSIVHMFGGLFDRIRVNIFRSVGIDKEMLDRSYVKPDVKAKEKVDL